MVLIRKTTIKQRPLKRKGNLYQQICSKENLILAEKRARKGKLKKPEVIEFDKCKESKIEQLHKILMNKEYKTSAYTTFVVSDPKERIVFRLPYFPDRIVHHAVMIPLEEIFVSMFTADTYSCIKKKGIHGAFNAVKKALNDKANTTYCLKLDIKKFYPSVDHEILKTLVRKKIKDKDLLLLLDEIIDSADGLPIGNYLSQYLANFYLSYFDHWIKENKREKYYFRYADDIVVLSSSKVDLHRLLFDIKNYLSTNLKLTVKGNYQVFPVASRGIDFVGYKFYHTHILLRKSIKKRFAKMLAKRKNKQSIDSYNGWTSHCNSKNLLKKLVYEQL